MIFLKLRLLFIKFSIELGVRLIFIEFEVSLVFIEFGNISSIELADSIVLSS